MIIRSAPNGSAPTPTTFRRSIEPHVELVSVRRTPIESIDATGINTSDAHYDVDVIVLATGFDAMTGALAKIDIVGRGGRDAARRLGRRSPHLSGARRRRIPEPLPGLRARRARGAGQHGAARRGTRELDRRRHRATSTSTATRLSKPPPTPSTTGSPNSIGGPRPRCSQGELLVLGSQCARQAEGVHVVPRRLRGRISTSATRSPTAGYKGFSLLKGS